MPEVSGPDATAYLRGIQQDALVGLNNALAVGANIAAGSYQARLDVIQSEIDRTNEALGRVNGLWSTWRDQAVNIIGINAQAAQASYKQYQQLIDQGYDKYEAAVKSGWNDYRAKVQGLINEYMASTRENYGQVMRRIPEYWRPVVDAIYQGTDAAIAAVRQGQTEEIQGIASAVAAASVTFSETARIIGNTDPDLQTEVMGDLNECARIAVEQATVEGVWGERLQRAVGELSIKAARYQVAGRLASLQQEMSSYLNEAEVMQYKLLESSAYQEAGQLAESAGARAQATVQVQASMESARQAYQTQRDEVILTANETAEQITFELGEQLRKLQQDYLLTQADQSAAVDTATAAAYAAWAADDSFNLSQIDFATLYMNERLQEAISLAGGDFDEIDWAEISKDVVEFFSGTSNFTPNRITSYQEFIGVLDDIQAAQIVERDTIANTFITDPSEAWSGTRADIATANGIDNAGYIGVGRKNADGVYIYAGLNLEESKKLTAALHTYAQSTMDSWFERPSRQELRLYQTAFDAIGTGSHQWEVDREMLTGGNMAFPLPGVAWDGSSNFHEDRGNGNIHQGIDINASQGTPILAMVAGEVIDVRYEEDKGGHIVEIMGLDGRRYEYMHMMVAPPVHIGDQVGAGMRIGQVGDTGNPQHGAYHLHLTVTTVGGTLHVNPVPFLAAALGLGGG